MSRTFYKYCDFGQDFVPLPLTCNKGNLPELGSSDVAREARICRELYGVLKRHPQPLTHSHRSAVKGERPLHLKDGHTEAQREAVTCPRSRASQGPFQSQAPNWTLLQVPSRTGVTPDLADRGLPTSLGHHRGHLGGTSHLGPGEGGTPAQWDFSQSAGHGGRSSRVPLPPLGDPSAHPTIQGSGLRSGMLPSGPDGALGPSFCALFSGPRGAQRRDAR